MAIVFQSATNAATGPSTTSTTLAVNKPTSTGVGDLLVTCISVIQGQTVTVLSGWTQLDIGNGTSGVALGVYYRVCDGTEGASFTWTVSLSAGSSLVAMTCLRFTGAARVEPVPLIHNNSGTGSVSTFTPTALSSYASKQAMTVMACGVRPDATGTPTLTMPSASGWTADANAKATATGSTFPAVVGASYKLDGEDTPAITTSAACEFAVVIGAFYAWPTVALNVNQAVKRSNFY